MKRTIVFAVWCSLVAPTALDAQGGRFVGVVVARWIEQDGVDRDMELVQPFEYVDMNGKRWSVPTGAVINGASIPQGLWIFGSPYTGDYRRASVVHDYYCTVRTEPWEQVHRMFFEASVDGGLSVISAKVMYSGVRLGGPRWELRMTKNLDGRERLDAVPIVLETPSDAELNELRQWVELNDPSPDEIDREVERRRPRRERP
jgi:Protein of unknown function (DUF1353)